MSESPPSSRKITKNTEGSSDWWQTPLANFVSWCESVHKQRRIPKYRLCGREEGDEQNAVGLCQVRNGLCVPRQSPRRRASGSGDRNLHSGEDYYLLCQLKKNFPAVVSFPLRLQKTTIYNVRNTNAFYKSSSPLNRAQTHRTEVALHPETPRFLCRLGIFEHRQKKKKKMFICFDVEFAREMQGGTAPEGKDTLGETQKAAD